MACGWFFAKIAEPATKTPITRVSATIFVMSPSRRQWRAFLRVARRPEDDERDAGIARMITAGQSWNSIQAATGCSRATIAKTAKRVKAAT